MNFVRLPRSAFESEQFPAPIPLLSLAGVDSPTISFVPPRPQRFSVSFVDVAVLSFAPDLPFLDS